VAALTEQQYRDPGDLPDLDWIDPELLDVDEAYQRRADQARIDKMVEWFDWRSFGALVVAPRDDGRYSVVDGQHRALAAKAHPLIELVPCVIIKATGAPAEAAAFIGLNKDRKAISALDGFWASIAAGEHDAERIKEMAERAGLKVLRYPASRGEYEPAETVATSAIAALMAKHGDRKTIAILEQLAKGRLAPVTSQHIKAAELLLTDAEFEDIDPETLWVAIDGSRATIDADAREFAATHRVPVWKAVASTWFRKARKRRRIAA
jgi:hypothetical protein